MKKLYDTPETIIMTLRAEDVIANSPIQEVAEGNGELDALDFFTSFT